MKIGIIGSGNVGGVLGSRWAAAGHNVVFSSRTPDSDEIKQLVAAAAPMPAPRRQRRRLRTAT